MKNKEDKISSDCKYGLDCVPVPEYCKYCYGEIKPVSTKRTDADSKLGCR